MKDWATVAFVFAMALTGWAQTLSTKDRLQITFSPDGILRDVRFAKKQFSGLGGFFVAEPTDTPEKLQWTPLKGKVELKGKTLVVQATGLGLGLTATFAEQPDAIFCEGILRDTSGSDRAIVLSFALPLDATNWQWWDNLRVARRIDPKTSTHYAATIRYGTRGEHSLYPFCALNTDDAGIALGIPLDLPVIHRFVYDAAQKQLRLEWDFGLSPDGGTRDGGRGTRERKPSTAVFKFAIYALDEPRWGMRAAADKFYRLFPESFRLRVKRFGIWMPFTDIAKIADFEDFGFAYHEGAQNPDFNRRQGIYNFRYEEPWSAWFYLPPDAPTDLTLEQLFAYPQKREQHPNLAEIVKVCGVQDEQGRFSLRAQKTDPVHWAGGQTLYNFLVNADPDIGRDEGRGARDGVTKASAMDKTLQTVLSDARLDGIYFDGFGEWVMPNENYRRDHWRVADFPLTFSWRTKRPTQLAAFGIYEYLAYAAEQLHAAGKLVMANGFGSTFPFHAHWVDVGGTEIRWTRQRDDFAFFDYRRVLAYRKPFLPLNNEFFDREFTGEIAEEYFRWALFYGFPPSCFAPGAGAFGNYWNTPEFHNRDRHLFRRYVPLIVRLCEAGWEPVTHAWSNNEPVLVERFGRWSDGNLHLTVYNASDQLQNATIAIDAAKLGLRERDARNLTVWVLTDLKTFPFAVGSTKLSPLTILISGTLAPRETAVLWLTAPDKALTSLAELAKVHLLRSVSKSQRRTQVPEQLLKETKQATDVQPKTLADWVQWLSKLQGLEREWKQQVDGLNIAADFAEASRIVGAAVRESLGLQTDASLPHEVAAGELLRIPVDIRNAGKETIKDAKLMATLSLSPQSLITSPQVELSLGDLKPRELRRELLMLKVPDEWANKRATLKVALQATVMGKAVILPIDEVSLRVLTPMEIEVAQFGGEPSILVRIRNNSSESREVQIKVSSPVEFVDRTVTIKARTTTEFKLTAIRPPTEMQLASAKVEVNWDEGRERKGRVVKWLSLLALPIDNNLLRNGSFEEGDKPPLPHWGFYGVGYKLDGEAVDGKQSIFCESDDTRTVRGAVQRVTLNQNEPVPLILHGFSKGENVFPMHLGGDYSLYLDARYVDGTPLWGEIVPFSGTWGRGHGTGWQWGWRLIVPEKPIREAVVYALFRYRKGRAWFDGVGLSELRLPERVKLETLEPKSQALVDGDFRTVWQNSGDQVIVLEAKSATIRQIAIWWQRPELKADFVRVEVYDGSDWKTVAERLTEGDTWLTVLDFAATKANQLRLTLKGKNYAVREVEAR
ncbi:hypothetical protein Q2T83_12790 [Fervidibacter sacchari]|uniref:F5/8 type C domain-containing protein n=1 Tax=Candidatus Fervidibacter sacchari TaxID=1448929 RepID=A0ABT2ENH0_9BACT|nr:hypothetical protein [Candidatus Fervidibacter sacchari]MCS3919476.1 hypothetical protein [Candidatus Fervidibacter sacchari]WKU15203.1 hypothetical protein Q2T83_12790 [Candidatus Fervidibacter sacchari]